MVNADSQLSRVRDENRLAKQNFSGFTVTEHIIVVAIVGLLTALAVPSISRTLQFRRLDSAASLVASKLAEARMNAIKRNRQAWLSIDPANQTISVQTTNNAGNTITVGNVEPLPTGVIFSLPTATSQVRFDSIGRLPTGTAAWTITLQGVSNTKRKSLGVSPTGLVSVANMVSY